jgi:hypothetical protein
VVDSEWGISWGGAFGAVRSKSDGGDHVCTMMECSVIRRSKLDIFG